MEKIISYLQKQLSRTKNKKEVEDSLEIYNWVRKFDGSAKSRYHKWSIFVTFSGKPPFCFYEPNDMGKEFLKIIRFYNSSQENK